MIRFIIRKKDCGAAANVGGPVDTTYSTYDADLPELERMLTEGAGSYTHIELVGAEARPADAEQEGRDD